RPTDLLVRRIGGTTAMRSSSLLVVALYLGLLAGTPMPRVHATAAAAPGVAQPPCSRVSLTPRPAWLSDALWLPRLGKILAVEASLERVLAYSADGKGTIVPEPSGE